MRFKDIEKLREQLIVAMTEGRTKPSDSDAKKAVAFLQEHIGFCFDSDCTVPEVRRVMRHYMVDHCEDMLERMKAFTDEMIADIEKDYGLVEET